MSERAFLPETSHKNFSHVPCESLSTAFARAPSTQDTQISLSQDHTNCMGGVEPACYSSRLRVSVRGHIDSMETVVAGKRSHTHSSIQHNQNSGSDDAQETEDFLGVEDDDASPGTIRSSSNSSQAHRAALYYAAKRRLPIDITTRGDRQRRKSQIKVRTALRLVREHLATT